MARTVVVWAGIVVGVFFFAVAAIYFLVPANRLPTFMPGYNPDLDKIHTTHGLGFLVLGILGFALSGLRSLGD